MKREITTEDQVLAGVSLGFALLAMCLAGGLSAQAEVIRSIGMPMPVELPAVHAVTMLPGFAWLVGGIPLALVVGALAPRRLPRRARTRLLWTAALVVTVSWFFLVAGLVRPVLNVPGNIKT